MQSLEAACEEGEHAYKKLKLSSNSLPLSSLQETEGVESSSKTPFCIHTKLLELHEEECSKNPSNFTSGLKRNSFLLEKLVAKERLNTMILNLYAGNKGYSIMVPMTSRVDQLFDDSENMIKVDKLSPYEEDRLLEYIDNEELPAYLLDVLEPNYSFLFYTGCIIAEIRDYRQAYPEFKCDIRHVLLRPTLQSILSDVNNLSSKDWTTEDKYQLESRLLLAREPNLCLNPDNSLCTQISRIHHNRQILNTHRLRRTARKFTQVANNRKRKLFAHKHDSQFYNFIMTEKPKTIHSLNALTAQCTRAARKIHEEFKPIPVPNLDSPFLSPPTDGVHITQFKALEREEETSDCLPQLIEEYVLETDIPLKEEGKKRLYHIKLSILQRPHNSEYLGELYLEWDHKENSQNGVACRFSLGSKAHATKYIQQFTDIFTEYGRKRVKIKYWLNTKHKRKLAATHSQATQFQAVRATQMNLAQQHLAQLSQNQAPVVNGALHSPGLSLIQQNRQLQNSASSVPILQSQLQGSMQSKTMQQNRSKESQINALVQELQNSVQQFQAAENAKQQQKLASSSNNAAIINLLKSSPACNINSDTNAAVVNAINNSSILPQVQTINQKTLARKISLSNASSARVVNNNLIAVKNNKMSVSDFNAHLNQLSQSQQGQQTITLNSSGNFAQTSYTNVPLKQPLVNQRILAASSNETNGKSTLSALLAGVPAADRPDGGTPSANSVLLEKLAASSSTSLNFSQSPNHHFIQSPKSAQQYTVQSPKISPVISPLSSPPPQNANTINVQSLNLAPFQNLSGVQNVQVQLTSFSQPISLSLNVSSTGAIQGHPTGLIVTLPVTTTATCSTVTQQAATNNVQVGGVGAPTVVLANAGTSNLAQLVTTGVKGLSQQGLRAAGPAGVTLSQGGQPFQLLAPMQRTRFQQANIQQNIAAARGIQRTPITIKMAAPNASAAQVTLPANATMNTIASQLQKQPQQYQQLYLNRQQKSVPANITEKVRRRSNAAEPQ